jgi:hypothetical protein
LQQTLRRSQPVEGPQVQLHDQQLRLQMPEPPPLPAQREHVALQSTM